MQRKLTDIQERHLAAKYCSGVSIPELSVQYGVSCGTVRNVLRRNGVEPPGGWKRRSGPILLSEREICTVLYEQGLSLRQIADVLELPPTRVRNALLAHSVQMRSVLKCHVLTDGQQQELCQGYIDGKTYAQLADNFGVAPTTVGEYLKRNGVTPRAGWASYRVRVWTDKRGREFRFKSSWELAYAKHLDEQGLSWDYEAAKFPLPKARCYTPDFWILKDGEVVEFVEVKGWLDDKQVNRMLEFAVRYPTEAKKLKVLGPADLAKMGLVEKKYHNHHMAAHVADLRKRLKEI